MSDFTRRSLFKATAAAPALAQSPRKGRPNVVVLMTDQQSVTALSANGNKDLKTPAMDSIAAEGTSFIESYCPYPVCSPSRSSIWTSRMSHETGVRVNGLKIADGIPNLGHIFTDAGYETAYCGKWHLPGNTKTIYGFQELPYQPYKGSGDPGARNDGPVASACIEYLHQKAKEPFLMVASFINPHDICEWIRAHRGSRQYARPSRFPYAPTNMGVDPNEPEYMQHHRAAAYDKMSEAVKIASEWTRDDVRYYLHGYYRLVEEVDKQVGRILDALKERGLMENTLVLLTSDHGEGMGAHRWAQKAGFWEEAVKVPFVLAGPGVGQRGVVDTRTLVSGLDIVPTLCDYAGVKPPPLMRGISLRGAIEGAANPRPFIVSEQSGFGGDDRQGRMLRTQRYKYVVYSGGARPEQLFDMIHDPGETLNLARRKEGQAALAAHRAMLEKWIAETKDDFRMPAG